MDKNVQTKNIDVEFVGDYAIASYKNFPLFKIFVKGMNNDEIEKVFEFLSKTVCQNAITINEKITAYVTLYVDKGIIFSFETRYIDFEKQFVKHELPRIFKEKGLNEVSGFISITDSENNLITEHQFSAIEKSNREIVVLDEGKCC